MRLFIKTMLLLVFATTIFSQTIKEYETKLRVCNEEIYKLDKAISNISSNYHSFQINGEISDRDKDLTFIQVWGTAIPTDKNYNKYGTLLKKNNIYIFNPDMDKIKYNFYISGIHFFREKKYVTNSFGATVPIFIYGDMDSQDKLKTMNIEENKKELLSKRSEILHKLDKEKKRKKIQNDFIFINNFKINSNNYKNLMLMISEFKNFLKLNNLKTLLTKQDYIYLDNIEKITISFKRQDEIENLKKYIRDSDFDYALTAVTNIRKLNKQIPEFVKDFNDTKLSKVETEIINKKKVFLAQKNKEEKERQKKQKIAELNKKTILLKNMKYNTAQILRNSFIPGKAHYRMKKNTKALIYPSIIIGSYVGYIVLNKKSKDDYDIYKDTADKSKYESANDKKLFGNSLFWVGTGIYFISIIDALITSHTFNSDIDRKINSIMDEKKQLSFHLKNDNILLSLQYKF